MAALPEDPADPLSRDPSEVALREFVRARKRKDEPAMRDAWRRLLTLEWSRIRTMVQARRHDSLPDGRVPHDDVEDVVHQVVLRLHDWIRLEGESIGEARAIIRNAVKFAVLDYLDQHVKDDQHRGGSLDEEDPSGEGPAAHVRRIEEELAEQLGDPFEDRERAKAVGRAIADLPETQRQVVVLRLSGHRSKEVADIVGLEPANVDQIHSRGLRQLRKALQDLR